MSGLLLLAVAVLWLVVATSIAIAVFKRLPERTWRFPVVAILFLALVPLPLIDEILGKKQFEQLCRENATIQVDRSTAAGRTVYLAEVPFLEATGTWIRVVVRPWRYVDAKTGETVVSYNTVQASGGRFVHALPLSEGRVPLLFRGSCVPADRPASAQDFSELGINYIERPTKKREAK